MPSITELVRQEAEGAVPVQSAAPFAEALVYALAGRPVPHRLIAQIAQEGGDTVALARAVAAHRRA